jgi:hypothetical protein
MLGACLLSSQRTAAFETISTISSILNPLHGGARSSIVYPYHFVTRNLIGVNLLCGESMRSASAVLTMA